MQMGLGVSSGGPGVFSKMPEDNPDSLAAGILSPFLSSGSFWKPKG